jgi:hypothetical protein
VLVRFSCVFLICSPYDPGGYFIVKGTEKVRTPNTPTAADDVKLSR